MRKLEDMPSRISHMLQEIQRIKLAQLNDSNAVKLNLIKNSTVYDKTLTVASLSQGEVDFTFTPDSGSRQLNSYAINVYKNSSTGSNEILPGQIGFEYAYIFLEVVETTEAADTVRVRISNLDASSNTYYIKLTVTSTDTGAIS